MPQPILTIRSSQMNTLGHEVERHFIDGLVTRFSRMYPELTDAEPRIAATISRARKYGFTSPEYIEWFLELDFARGFEWELAPEMNWTIDFLDTPDVDPAGRKHRLEKWLRKWDDNAK